MQPELEAPRRLLLVAYRRYVEADRDWTVAARAARAWFPALDAPPRGVIGQPGSRLRRLYDRRERALQRLLAAREKLERARRRVRRREPHARLALRLISVSQS